jgi:hypothetical protein
MPMVKLLVLLLMAALTASACASGRAQVVEDKPTLVVPPVPPRTIEPQPAIQPITVEPPAEATPPPTTATKPKPAPKNNTEPKTDSKPESPPETTTASATNPPPVGALRSPTTPSGPDAVRQIREALQRAEAILGRVNYQKLGEDRRANYNSAKNFILQAEEKIKQEDLTLALNFAQRAETTAKALLETGR